MTTYALTVSTNDLGLGVLSGARVVVERKRTQISDIFSGQALIKNTSATNTSGIAVMFLSPDDSSVYHELKIFDLAGIPVYSVVFTMPPQAVSLVDLPVQDIVSASAAAALESVATATAQAGIATAQAGIATAQAVISTDQAGIATAQAGIATAQAADALSSAAGATVSAAAALAAKTLAETARDAANVNGKIYATIGAGIAATVSGEYFSVPSTVTEELLILYLNSAGSAIEQKRYYVGVSTPKILQKTENWLSLLRGITWSDGYLNAGVPNGNTSYKSTDFIPVVAGDVYCTNIVFAGQARTFYYDSEKAVVGSGVLLTSGTSFTVPSGTGITYIRLCTTNAIYTQVEAPPLHPPYLVHAVSIAAAGGYVPPTASTTTIDYQGDIDAITAIAKAVPSKITAITETTLNHINAATNSVGYLNNTGALVANATYFCTDFIPVETGKTYTTNCVPVYSATYTGYYNKYKNLISVATLAATAGSVGASSPVTFTITDPNVAFIRISSAVDVPNKMMTDGSTMPSTFQAYNAKKLAFPATITRDLNVYGLDGLKWACYGDSITSAVAAAAIGATNYHQQIAAKTGIIPIDYGVGGSRIARPTGITITDCMTDRIPSGDVTADIITLMGGVNDATSSLGVTPLGVMSDRTTTTFYGALHVACLALLERFPSKGIGLITQTPRHNYMSAQLPYVNAMIEVAQYYSIPCLDLNRSSGLYPDSVYYYTNYFGDTNPDAYGLHPNTIGHSVIARQILQFIMKLKPL